MRNIAKLHLTIRIMMASPPILQEAFESTSQPIRTVEMHTTGEPTRIIYSGFPQLRGETLLEKRADAKANHDHIRRRLMHEPRGHKDMYGALLVSETELTAELEAGIGVLFMHNEGWSTMCGHATIALGRFLVDFEADDCRDICIRGTLAWDDRTLTTEVKLHCPCGVVKITVPIIRASSGRWQSDPNRDATFVNVESFATGIDIGISLPKEYRWPELIDRDGVRADFCYGGAFYCIIKVEELGFEEGLVSSNTDNLSRAAAMLKSAVNDSNHTSLFRHPTEKDLGFLYGVIVTDDRKGPAANGATGGELGLCFFANQQIDRSPTGSGVAARRALAHAKGRLSPETRWTYHSLLSLDCGQGAFTAHVVDEAKHQDSLDGKGRGVRVSVEGRAFYTGIATYLVEPGDEISRSGFVL